MARVLDFTTAKKQFLTITFIDGEKILVKNPTKKIMDNLVNLGKSFEEVEDNDSNTNAINDIYNACAEIMSNNIAKKPITVEYLSDVLDLEDLNLFFTAYMEFVGDLNTVKN